MEAVSLSKGESLNELESFMPIVGSASTNRSTFTTSSDMGQMNALSQAIGKIR
jgi:hypothetical protein